jgi:hypothetical protein
MTTAPRRQGSHFKFVFHPTHKFQCFPKNYGLNGFIESTPGVGRRGGAAVPRGAEPGGDHQQAGDEPDEVAKLPRLLAEDEVNSFASWSKFFNFFLFSGFRLSKHGCIFFLGSIQTQD